MSSFDESKPEGTDVRFKMLFTSKPAPASNTKEIEISETISRR